MPATYLNARPILVALLELGQSRTRIARAVGCDSQLVLCWLFGMQMNASRRPQCVKRLIDFAIDLGMRRINDTALHGADPQPAAIDAIQAAYGLLQSFAEHSECNEAERAA